MITVEKETMLKSIVHHEDKELALVKENNTVYQYDGATGEWKPYVSDGSLTLNLKDLNATVIPQLPTLTPAELNDKKSLIAEFVKKGKWFMLLSNSYHYYTVFVHSGTEELMEDVVLECLQGEIKSIDLTDDEQAIEIWTVIDDTVYEFYLFEYGNGVIECQ